MKLASYVWRGESHIGFYADDKLFSLTQILGGKGAPLRSMSSFLADAALVALARDLERQRQGGVGSAVAPATSLAVKPLRAAIFSIVSWTKAGSLRLPRRLWGERKGASVSTVIASRGSNRAASCRASLRG